MQMQEQIESLKQDEEKWKKEKRKLEREIIEVNKHQLILKTTSKQE